ncbi:uncharacterized protein BDV14DRAFT_212136 [Aspergillus stella-maris]|uniref:uncharacterized protein n=1 Tax=Aspergillus stella-maris TaxID=1810926 RepID=UPI003CCD5432
MYEPVALDLSYANQPLPRHYESDEEDISESEYTSHSRSATLDSITTTTSDVDRPALPRLLSPFTEKSSRPVSMDTVKRSSSATFVTEPCTIFDNDDDSMILELPSPDSTTPLQSPIFLQPAVYVPSEPLTSPRTSFHSLSSSSAASIYSDDDSDVCVAEQVTYVEHAKPNLILISPTATEQSVPSPRDLASPTSSSDGSVYSNDEASHSQPVFGETPMDRGRSRYYHNKSQGSLSALDTLQKCTSRQPSAEPMSAPAVEARRLSFRARSMSFSRPQTPASASTDRRRLQKEPPRRPPSAASTATFSLFPTQSQTQLPHGQAGQDDDARARSTSLSYSYSLHSAASSTYSLSSSQPPSRTASPNPYYNPYNRSRSGSLYSISSTTTAPTGKRPPMPYRGSLVKSSTFNVSGNGNGHGYSSSSLRAELGSANGSGNGQPQNAIDDASKLDSRTRRKKSMKQLKPSHGHSESKSKAGGFVGFMLGQRSKRKSVIKT